jgi:hypothetical protein
MYFNKVSLGFKEDKKEIINENIIKDSFEENNNKKFDDLKSINVKKNLNDKNLYKNFSNESKIEDQIQSNLFNELNLRDENNKINIDFQDIENNTNIENDKNIENTEKENNNKFSLNSESEIDEKKILSDIKDSINNLEKSFKKIKEQRLQSFNNLDPEIINKFFNSNEKYINKIKELVSNDINIEKENKTQKESLLNEGEKIKNTFIDGSNSETSNNQSNQNNELEEFLEYQKKLNDKLDGLYLAKKLAKERKNRQDLDEEKEDLMSRLNSLNQTIYADNDLFKSNDNFNIFDIDDNNLFEDTLNNNIENELNKNFNSISLNERSNTLDDNENKKFINLENNMNNVLYKLESGIENLNKILGNLESIRNKLKSGESLNEEESILHDNILKKYSNQENLSNEELFDKFEKRINNHKNTLEDKKKFISEKLNDLSSAPEDEKSQMVDKIRGEIHENFKNQKNKLNNGIEKVNFKENNSKKDLFEEERINSLEKKIEKEDNFIKSSNARNKINDIKSNEQKQGDNTQQENNQNETNNISEITMNISNDLKSNKANENKIDNSFRELEGKVNNHDLDKIKKISENFQHSIETINQIINTQNQQGPSKDNLNDVNNAEKYILNTANQVYNNERGR